MLFRIFGFLSLVVKGWFAFKCIGKTFIRCPILQLPGSAGQFEGTLARATLGGLPKVGKGVIEESPLFVRLAELCKY